MHLHQVSVVAMFSRTERGLHLHQVAAVSFVALSFPRAERGVLLAEHSLGHPNATLTSEHRTYSDLTY